LPAPSKAIIWGRAGKDLRAKPVPRHLRAAVCQKELFCEKGVPAGNPKTKLEPVAIGALERFAADYYQQAGESRLPPVPPWNGMRVALVGSGPCLADHRV
jgi:NADPH-dependent glutamate synthase beta subunit-like oxidoreductase